MLRSVARLPFLAVRRLRWWRGAWSKDSDRSYHEQLYEAQAHDPFDARYPGYVTIRRFADHAEALLPAAGTVLDLGCGPGEITCELARRHPRLSFLGIDHSAHAIRRAAGHATRLGLANVRFAVGDAEQLPPEDRYGLITMFDAFHHLERPDTFLGWLRARTSRVLLIEPAGTWSGGWARGIDVDWVLADLANVRERLEAVCGVSAFRTLSGTASGTLSGTLSGTPPARGDGAVERRYALDDFARFFDGWTLRITGTVAGIDRYPPAASGRSPLGPIAGELAYALIRATDEQLVAHGRDGAAKHWVVAATSEPDVLVARLPDPAPPPAAPPPSTVASACAVRYVAYHGPRQVDAGAEFDAAVEIVNGGWETWASDATPPVHASYHWRTATGDMVTFDGLRSGLAQPIAPGDAARVPLTVRAPAQPGTYVLAIDLVKEGVTWFSEAGAASHDVRVDVG